MRIAEIAAMPRVIEAIPPGTRGVHESVLRAYQILEKAKDLMRRNTPVDVVLELIAEMERGP
jgi:hypothetical protein